MLFQNGECNIEGDASPRLNKNGRVFLPGHRRYLRLSYSTW